MRLGRLVLFIPSFSLYLLLQLLQRVEVNEILILQFFYQNSKSFGRKRLSCRMENRLVYFPYAISQSLQFLI
jgi:hypothetical protein